MAAQRWSTTLSSRTEGIPSHRERPRRPTGYTDMESFHVNRSGTQYVFDSCWRMDSAEDPPVLRHGCTVPENVLDGPRRYD